jgi:hypothetical protein
MAIIDEGREQQAKRLLLSLGKKLFGPAPDTIIARLHGITEDVDRLERMHDRILDASNWEDLLDTP